MAPFATEERPERSSGIGPVIVFAMVLVVAKVIAPRFFEFISATAGLLHQPLRSLSSSLGPEPPESPVGETFREDALEALRTHYSGAVPKDLRKPGRVFAATAIEEWNLRSQTLHLSRPVVTVGPGDAIVFRRHLLGFVQAVEGNRVLGLPLHGAGWRLEVEVLVDSGNAIKAIAASENKNPSFSLRLEFPKRREPLRESLPVVTRRARAFHQSGLIVTVPSGLELGRLVLDPARSMERVNAYSIEMPNAMRSERRAAILARSSAGPPPFPSQGGDGYERRNIECCASPEVAGAGMDIDIGVEGGATRGQAISLGPYFIGRVEQVGLLRSRVRRLIDGAFSLNTVAHGRGPLVTAPIDIMRDGGRFRLRGSGQGLSIGDVLLTTGTDVGIPGGLVVGTVDQVDRDGGGGRLRSPRPTAGSPLVLWRPTPPSESDE